MDEAILKIIKKIVFSHVCYVEAAASTRTEAGFTSSSTVPMFAVTLVALSGMFSSKQAFAEDIFGAHNTLGDTSYKITMPGAAPAFN